MCVKRRSLAQKRLIVKSAFPSRRMNTYEFQSIILFRIIRRSIKHIISFFKIPWVVAGQQMRLMKRFFRFSPIILSLQTMIVIEDDGVGVEDREQLSSGYGINNVKERIHLLYGESYGVSVWSQKGKGVRVTIQLPRYSEVLDEF